VSFQVKDSDCALRIAQSFSRQGVMAHLGAKLGEVSPGFCEILIDFTPQVSQQHGYFHGGIIGTIADSAGGYAGYTLMPADSSVLTVEYKLSLMSPADGQTLIARGHVIKPGNRLTFTRADIVVVKDGVEKLCATLVQTLICMVNTPDTQPAQ
jgi:uncharacterized protein (TIGR00369 family)